MLGTASSIAIQLTYYYNEHMKALFAVACLYYCQNDRTSGCPLRDHIIMHIPPLLQDKILRRSLPAYRRIPSHRVTSYRLTS